MDVRSQRLLVRLRSGFRFGLHAGICCASLMGFASTAWASPTPTELKAARELFISAEGDEDAGRWQEALEKLHQVASVRLTAGVRYHIALCEQRVGKLRMALDDFEAAEQAAQAENAADVLRMVGTARAELSARVPEITVRPVPDVPRFVITLDGTIVPAESARSPQRVDPGEHHVDVTAPGRTPGHAAIAVGERDRVTVDVPIPLFLEVPSNPSPPPVRQDASSRQTEPAPTPLESPSHRNTLPAWLATGTAVVLAGAGVGAYFLADDAHRKGVEQCAQLRSLDPNACASERTSVRAWDWTAAGAWAGAAASAVLAVVLWAQPDRKGPPGAGAQVVGPQLRVDPQGLRVEGAF